jgi:phosphoglycerate dehydrogenase-like enzyme
MTTTVLLAYPHVDVGRATAQVKAVSPDVTVLACPYETSHEVRTLRDEQPWSPRIPEVMPPLSDEQADAFGRATVVLSLDIPMELGKVAPSVRWVQNIGSGFSRYRSAGLAEAGIMLTTAAGASADGIAEFVLARLLEHWKRLPEIAERQRRGDWGFTFGRRAAGKTVCVVGVGAIGGHVARMCRALGMHVVGVARTSREEPRVDQLYPVGQLREALSRADAVVLCATDTAANENLFGPAEFAAMTPGSFFVNVSRGRLVDDEALVAALRGGHLAAAATDVARTEPVPADSPLWSVEGLRLSPHSASTQEGYADRVVDLFCDNLARFLDGRPLRNQVELT